MLNMKPLLRINPEGKLETIGKKRGVAAAMQELLQSYEEQHDPDRRQQIFLLHADCPENAARLQALTLERFPQAEISLLSLGPVIGAHTGPGLLAMVYFTKGT